MTRQTICRTYDSNHIHPTNELRAFLSVGWKAVFVTQCNDYIEYILEKDFEEESETKEVK